MKRRLRPQSGEGLVGDSGDLLFHQQLGAFEELVPEDQIEGHRQRLRDRGLSEDVIAQLFPPSHNKGGLST